MVFPVTGNTSDSLLTGKYSELSWKTNINYLLAYFIYCITNVLEIKCEQ